MGFSFFNSPLIERTENALGLCWSIAEQNRRNASLILNQPTFFIGIIFIWKWNIVALIFTIIIVIIFVNKKPADPYLQGEQPPPQHDASLGLVAVIVVVPFGIWIGSWLGWSQQQVFLPQVLNMRQNNDYFCWVSVFKTLAQFWGSILKCVHFACIYDSPWSGRYIGIVRIINTFNKKTAISLYSRCTTPILGCPLTLRHSCCHMLWYLTRILVRPTATSEVSPIPCLKSKKLDRTLTILFEILTCSILLQQCISGWKITYETEFSDQDNSEGYKVTLV